MRKSQNFFTESYWRTAIILLVVSGVVRQTGSDIPSERGILTLIVEDLANIGALIFIVAGIVRAIDSRRKSNQR
jgi:hypothetical protein